MHCLKNVNNQHNTDKIDELITVHLGIKSVVQLY